MMRGGAWSDNCFQHHKGTTGAKLARGEEEEEKDRKATDKPTDSGGGNTDRSKSAQGKHYIYIYFVHQNSSIQHYIYCDRSLHRNGFSGDFPASSAREGGRALKA